jgi:hypothetical protein
MAEREAHGSGPAAGDPRDGLAPAALAAFYRARPAQWLVRGVYRPDAAEKRAGAVAAHGAFIRANLARIRFAGPLFGADGEARTGTWFLFDLPDRKAVEVLMATEGFNRAGMFQAIEIARFVETSFDDRRQADTRPDPKLEMFLCEMTDGPPGRAIREAEDQAQRRYLSQARERFVIHGPMLSDDGAEIVGSTWIVAVENRGAAEALIAACPLARAGAFGRIRIDRWRFGATIG